MKQFENRKILIASKHRKDLVLSPILRDYLGVIPVRTNDYDTDCYGTFTGEIERPAGPVETLRMKIENAAEQLKFDLVIGSEGSFGPHPNFPWVPCDTELVMILDRLHNQEFLGVASDVQTNFAQKEVHTVMEARKFAESVGFPSHALIVRDTDGQIVKGINQFKKLETLVKAALLNGNGAGVTLETDMRAHMNPSRMKVIEKAALNLVQRIQTECPSCKAPGFGIVSREKGLPCSICRYPTQLILRTHSQCNNCGYHSAQLYPDGISLADPMYCDECNP